jgi:hypothetical protein
MDYLLAIRLVSRARARPLPLPYHACYPPALST